MAVEGNGNRRVKNHIPFPHQSELSSRKSSTRKLMCSKNNLVNDRLIKIVRASLFQAHK